MSGRRLPGAGSTTVPADKMRDYLLTPDHPDNGGKAGFFLRFGFAHDRWGELQAALAAHPIDNDVVRATPVGEGMRYRVQFSLASPDQRNPCVVTLWAVEGGAPPRLITAFRGPVSGSPVRGDRR